MEIPANMRLVPAVLLTLVMSWPTSCQTYAITTVAGNGTQGFSGDGGPAASAQLWGPHGLAADSAGNLYIADTLNGCIRKVSNGVITTVAGNGALTEPYGVAVDSAGNLYIADAFSNRIYKVSNGVITTVAGNGMPGFSGDNGPATSAQLNSPYGSPWTSPATCTSPTLGTTASARYPKV